MRLMTIYFSALRLEIKTTASKSPLLNESLETSQMKHVTNIFHCIAEQKTIIEQNVCVETVEMAPSQFNFKPVIYL